MDDLRSMAVFAETVDAGSMSAAARRLGMSPSAVSQTIRTLEEGAGVVLLHRSTRKLRLTEAGERYYPHCKRATRPTANCACRRRSALPATSRRRWRPCWRTRRNCACGCCSTTR